MEDESTEVTTVTQRSAPAQVVRTTKTVVPPAIKTEHPQERYETKRTIFRAYQIIWYILGLIETLLFFRIILKVFGANPSSGFADFIYRLSEPLAMPFVGLFRIASEGQSVFELGTFIGCIVYLVVAYGLVELFQLIKPTSPGEVEENV